MQKFKCHTCYSITDHNPCPECDADHLIKMCEEDHVCTCVEDVHSGVRYCEKCGAAVCPCGSHDVVQVSRVTGYLADVSGFNKAKKQELKDRHRVNVT